MQQTIAGAFRSKNLTFYAPGLPTNLLDFAADASLNPDASWSPGATLIDQLEVSPPAGQAWTIESYSISFAGALLQPIIGPAAAHSYGTLGKIITAIMIGQTPTPAGFVTPMQPLPNNVSTVTTLWDGSQDPPFGQTNITTTPPGYVNNPIVASGNLPNPIGVGPGEQISVGLWLTPSLVQNTGILVIGAQYTVIYDDGRPTGVNAR